ncbi:SDR family NAD(P)-dependent oxidoreductase [Candidatus Poribacteria bacterium]|nr:SDR family NAD(P)-dependent oxidoreductase [Candidatus Poribacteria bacterium]
MKDFRIIAINPPGLIEPSIAVSASKAGGIGVLNLEYIQDQSSEYIINSLAVLSKYANKGYGIKMSFCPDISLRISELISSLSIGPEVIILTRTESHCQDLDILKEQIQLLQEKDLQVIVESLCLEDALNAEKAGADAVIVKGHESAGRIGEETTFVLLQNVLKNLNLPVYAQGGIGLHTAPACYAAGAAGIVLDSQLLLTRESHLSDDIKDIIKNMDGSETRFFGRNLGESYRMYYRPNLEAVKNLEHIETEFIADERKNAEILPEWREIISDKVGWKSPQQNIMLLGQDAAFAAPLAEKFVTVGGIFEGIRKSIDKHIQLTDEYRPFEENSPLAELINTRYPIFQGPMARISDTAEFAVEIAQGGALPFLAISLMPGDELRKLLQETHKVMGDHPWGVGIIGFLPPDLYSQQQEVILECKPPFVLIAGSRPRQTQPLEAGGIISYVHVPSTGLLDLFLKGGDKRFILEGRESGGHIGPRTSFVLWEAMVDKILEHVNTNGNDPGEYHVIFAGGIHDDLSASMVSVIAAPLAQKGVKVGIQMGTAYLFTKEIVEAGGITDTYQQESLRCDGTVYLEVGPGHANRCICTPFAEAFEEEKKKLLGSGKSAEEIRFALEQISIGRLYTAAKGTALIDSKVVKLPPEEQLDRGVYMIGQIGALKDNVISIDELHREVSEGSIKLIEQVNEKHEDLSLSNRKKQHTGEDIAIVGMASVFPKAGDIHEYWENILDKVNTVQVVPKERWDWELYYDPDPRAKDKVYSKWGCFLDDIHFDPLNYGMPPKTLESIEPLQLLTLEVVRKALKDAGYDKRPFPRERTSVIIGTGGGGADLAQGYGARSTMPSLFGKSYNDVLKHFEDNLPEWTEDSFAGILANVTAGRVANRFNLGGENYIVDAACASSLAAVHLAVKELNTHNSDMVIVGGADTMQNSFAFLCFSKTMALSPTGECRTMDEKADGIVLGEGVAMMIFKRLEDAERDGDKIYAVIKSVGASSDGRDKSMTAPRPDGQALALRRAYEKANVSPTTIELIEAHGTGTVVGDKAEIQALSKVFNENNVEKQNCAIGSVKSMIGHTKCTAGVASVIKASMALHHKVLPPTIGVDHPNPDANFPESPFYVNTQVRPWLDLGDNHPRRAGVSAFGFGGTNFHTVIEEYNGYRNGDIYKSAKQKWPSELFIWKGESRQEISEKIGLIKKASNNINLRDISYSVYKNDRDKPFKFSLAIIANSIDDLKQKAAIAQKSLKNNSDIDDPRGIFFTENPIVEKNDTKIAFLFPGQGSQYVNMLLDLSLDFPEIRESFELANKLLHENLDAPLSRYIYPQPWFSEEEKTYREEKLKQAHIAQPAVGVASMAMYRLLNEFGLKADFLAGHSYGEYVALWAAGVFDENVLIDISEARGRFIIKSAGKDPGTMAAVNADVPVVSEIIEDINGVYIANKNSPDQTVISGTIEGITKAVKEFKSREIRTKVIPVACAFHSPIVDKARVPLKEFLNKVELSAPEKKVFSNVTAKLYPKKTEAVANTLVKHLISSVEFVQEIQNMYEAGARVFIEVGPRSVLTKLTNKILSEKPHLAVASDQHTRNGITQLQHMFGRLITQGINVNLDRFYNVREVKLLNLNSLDSVDKKEVSPTTWLVNGHRAKPISKANQPDPVFPNIKVKVVDENEKVERQEYMKNQQNNSLSESSSINSSQQIQEQVKSQNQAQQKTVKASNNGSTQVMMQYQQLMNRFLDTQKSIMMTYLQNGHVKKSSHTNFSSFTQPVVNNNPPGQPVNPPVSNIIPETPVADVPPAQAPAPTSIQQPRVEVSQPVNQVVEKPQVTEEETKQKELGLTKEELTEKLLDVVSERTGYPKEMLDLDLDMEADLGIDSIKRIEILGSSQEFYNLEEAAGQESDMQDNETLEELASLKTLREIIDWIDQRVNSTDEVPIEDEVLKKNEISKPDTATATDYIDKTASDTDIITEQKDTVGRYKIITEEKPIQSEHVITLSDKPLILVDDENGIAAAVSQSLRNTGKTTIVVRYSDEDIKRLDDNTYSVNLGNWEAVSSFAEAVKENHGSVGGFISFLPLNKKEGLRYSFPGMTLDNWQQSLNLSVKSLFYFAKAFGEDLRDSADSSDAFFMSVSEMGGTFAAINADEFFPGHGGITGFVKALSHEWPKVRIRAIDLPKTMPAPERVETLMQEISCDDNMIEVGYSDGNRIILVPQTENLDKDQTPELKIDSSSVILVTGGARGITADVAVKLAQNYKPNLILMGRSPMPEDESSDTSGLTKMQDIKAAIINRIKTSGEKVTPVEVESKYSRLMKDREMRDNLSKMKAAGAKVEYLSADVRDKEKVTGIIENIYKEYGRLDGVIHGAGIIEDKLVKDKTPESFDRVFDTKVNSAFILSKALKPKNLSFFVIFSSVAGRFGNRGQSDYSAANEVYNKLAVYLDKKWPGRIVSTMWGPWARSKGGMVSSELEKQFALRGVELVPSSIGPKKLDEEIKYGAKGEVEIILGGKGWDALRPGSTGLNQEENQQNTPTDKSVSNIYPLISTGDEITREDDGSITISRKLDISRDLYLNDHQIDNKPVFPMAVGLELMSEAAMIGWEGYHLTEVSDLQVLQGIVVDNKETDIKIVAKPILPMNSTYDTKSLNTLEIEVNILPAITDKPGRAHYRSKVKLQKEAPEKIHQMSIYLEEQRSYPLDIETAYNQILFQKGIFKGISDIESIGSNGILAKVNASRPEECVSGLSAESKWIIDPVITDSGLQLIILWTRENLDMTPLPSRMSRFRRFGSMANQDVECQIHINANPVTNVLSNKLVFFGEDGKLLGLMEGMELICSKALNRLSHNRV